MKNILFHRDFLMLALLLCLLKIGVEMREPTIGGSPIIHASTHTAQAEALPTRAPESQKTALHETPEKNETDIWEVSGHEDEKVEKKYPPFLVHEVDESVFKQIECAHNQINQALDITQPTSLDAAQLRSLQQKLTQLRMQYQSTSPAIALLGPLGTAAIVLKEDGLEKELLHTIHKIGSIIHNLAGNIHQPADSIVKELEANHTLLSQLSHV